MALIVNRAGVQLYSFRSWKQQTHSLKLAHAIHMQRLKNREAATQCRYYHAEIHKT